MYIMRGICAFNYRFQEPFYTIYYCVVESDITTFYKENPRTDIPDFDDWNFEPPYEAHGDAVAPDVADKTSDVVAYPDLKAIPMPTFAFPRFAHEQPLLYKLCLKLYNYMFC